MSKKEKRTESSKEKKPRFTYKEKAFIENFVKTRNGTQSALAVYDVSQSKNPANTASIITSENLAKPRIKNEIERIFAEQGMTMEEVLSIHKRNMMQEEHLPTSQRAVKDFYEVIGLTEKTEKPSVNIAFVIEN